MATRTPNNLVAFPSVASSLHALPRATSMANVNLHPNLYASRANESEAKVCNIHPIILFTFLTNQPRLPASEGTCQNSERAQA